MEMLATTYHILENHPVMFIKFIKFILVNHSVWGGLLNPQNDHVFSFTNCATKLLVNVDRLQRVPNFSSTEYNWMVCWMVHEFFRVTMGKKPIPKGHGFCWNQVPICRWGDAALRTVQAWLLPVEQRVPLQKLQKL